MKMAGKTHPNPLARSAAIPKTTGQPAVTSAVITTPTKMLAKNTRGSACSGESFSQFRRRIQPRKMFEQRIAAPAPHAAIAAARERGTPDKLAKVAFTIPWAVQPKIWHSQ
jgi:hypothetical protein